ncbi:MAG TPA: hemolysin III family protein [Acidimicrobiales bacterium]|nr:hemolysin III family protein [Acidimicrobiales bacterium]
MAVLPADDGVLVRPALRGVLHRYAAVAFAAGFGVLVASAGAAALRPWLAVHGTSVTAMLAVSAVYHSGRLSPAARATFKRIDHSTILLAIAGSYTGVVGLAVEGGSRVWMLGAVWVLAGAGMAIRMLWLDAPYPVVAAVYVAVGWVAALDLDALTGALTAGELVLVVAGGVLYTLGAVVYALHAPNPWPRTFGYHEVFHALVVLAAAAHLVTVSLIAGRLG